MINFYGELNDHLKNEYKDVLVYADLSKKASDPGEAQILKDIAREEYIHAGHLEGILKDAGMLEESPENKEKAKAVFDEL